MWSSFMWSKKTLKLILTVSEKAPATGTQVSVTNAGSAVLLAAELHLHPDDN